MEQETWKGKHYAFFCNEACEYFPCHPSPAPERFNCLFCYCPLYCLGEQCGGAFRYLPGGIKDCSGCSLPHDRDRYGEIVARFGEIVKAMGENRT